MHVARVLVSEQDVVPQGHGLRIVVIRGALTRERLRGEGLGYRVFVEWVLMGGELLVIIEIFNGFE